MTESTYTSSESFGTSTPGTGGNASSNRGGAAQMRTLYRHPTNRMLGGVCAGVADYLGWSEVAVRLLWFVFAMATSGAGFIVYLLLWLLLPIGTQATGPAKSPAIDLRIHTGKPLAFVLIAIGVLWLLSNLGILPALGALVFGIMKFAFWPALLILIGWKILRSVGGADLNQQMSEWRTNVADWTSSASAQINEGRQAAADNPGGLYRSRTNRVVMGVCGGIGEHYGVDPTLVRLLWAMLAIASLGLGVVAYIIAAILLPEGDAAFATGAASHDPNAAEEIAITPASDESVKF